LASPIILPNASGFFRFDDWNERRSFIYFRRSSYHNGSDKVAAFFGVGFERPSIDGHKSRLSFTRRPWWKAAVAGRPAAPDPGRDACEGLQYNFAIAYIRLPLLPDTRRTAGEDKVREKDKKPKRLGRRQ
jgi:hypothetical protein